MTIDSKIDLLIRSHESLHEDVRQLGRTQVEYHATVTTELRNVTVVATELRGSVAHVVDRTDEHSADLARQAAQIAEIERQQAWIKAWSAGALAVVLAIGGGITWLVSTMPVAGR